MKTRRIIAVAAALLLTVPGGAVFKEKNLPQTLSVLHYELLNAYVEIQKISEGASANEKIQHQMLVGLIENCNELSLMLYSQQNDFTFDLTYALNEVTKQYDSFHSSEMPYDLIIEKMEIEIDRYEKLARTLKYLPPSLNNRKKSSYEMEDSLMTLPSFVDTDENPYMLDEAAQAERDSCLYYTELILDLYWETLFKIDEDNTYYTETDNHLKEAYNYAQERYEHVQKTIFIDGQRDYLTILQGLNRYIPSAWQNCVDKYSSFSKKSEIVSEWRGIRVVGFSLMVLVIMFLAVILSFVVSRLFMRWIPFLRSEDFQKRRFLFIMLSGVVIFAIFIMVVDLVTVDNFMDMALPLVAEFAWLHAAIFASLLIRLDTETESRTTLSGYLPIILMTLLIVTFRIIFVPNSVINILFPPILLLFSLWQYFVIRKISDRIDSGDRTFMWITLCVLVVSTVIAMVGYVMMALLVVIWWIFQLMVVMSITAIFNILSRYYEKHLSAHLSDYRKKHPGMPLSSKASFIEVTWFYDFLKMAAVPILSIWSLPLCVYMAGDVFDFSKVSLRYFSTPFISVEKVINLSVMKIVIVASLFFLFYYLSYAGKAFYRLLRIRNRMKKLGDGVVFKESEINFTLSDNLISLLCWGLFIVISFVMLQIPTSAITIITTGLATGMGFAMKDVLNNFFYGIQLMSGRLRVGDVIECDGIRGTVDSMSYQSTQIVATDGSVIAFPNSTLFAKNFKNLTKNHSYELLAFEVGVKYGTDVDKARKVIVETLKSLQGKDKYGREIVDTKKGTTVRVERFGDNSVDLKIIQFTTVDTHFTYAAQAKELIYKAFAENGIEIPFPQRDLYVKEFPLTAE